VRKTAKYPTEENQSQLTNKFDKYKPAATTTAMATIAAVAVLRRMFLHPVAERLAKPTIFAPITQRSKAVADPSVVRGHCEIVGWDTNLIESQSRSI
jgi:hypothetical protein